MAKADNVASNPLKEEMVTIVVPRGKDREPLFVSRNGKGMYIQRGVKVEVPKGIAEIIENMDRQDDIVYELIQEAEKTAKSDQLI